MGAGVEVDEGVLATWDAERGLHFLVYPDDRDDYASVAVRLCGTDVAGPALRAENGGRTIQAGEMLEVPWHLARYEYRYLAIRSVFPDDSYREGFWHHDPTKARLYVHDVRPSDVSLWFTGDSSKWSEIAAFNGTIGEQSYGHAALRIPGRLLLPVFVPEPSAPGPLRFREDGRGRYAEYRLSKNENIFRDVVPRFTDSVEHAAVGEAAQIIAKRSGLSDPRHVPKGARIKIPLDLLSVSHLPTDDRRRVIAKIRETELGVPVQVSLSLEKGGFHVVIDPGHGGDDIGTRNHRIWESDYVYDIACRLQRRLVEMPELAVHLLVRDLELGCRIFDSRKLRANKKEVILTDPPHAIRYGSETLTGVHLRWTLANSILEELQNVEQVPAEHVIFMSLHADSLHPELTGAVVYVPGASFRRQPERFQVSDFEPYAEARFAEDTSFTRWERIRDERVSRALAESILEGYRRAGLPVDDHKAVRDHIVRGENATRWVPAVLRNNTIPGKVLIETANIANAKDAALLGDYRGREMIASAIANGVRAYFNLDSDSRKQVADVRPSRASVTFRRFTGLT